MKRLLPLLFAAAACSPAAYLPDGGRPRQVCQNTFSSIGVKAQDLMGVAIPNAEVIARNASTGVQQTGTTGGDGRTAAITDELGNGQIQITATAGSLKTRQPFIIELTCGECDCTAQPGNATLTLQ